MKKCKVYVVEDMAISRAALIDLLEESNFNVVGSAANADKAWEDIQLLEVELALLDINLAGKKDGIWLGEKIREYLNIPIVFLTAYGDDETINKLSKINPNGYLMKPYNIPTLITTINIAIKSFESLQETASPVDHLFTMIDEGTQKIRVYLKDILYILSDGNYIELHCKNANYTFRCKLQTFLETIPQNNFIMRTHLRYAVNIKEINIIHNNKIIVNAIEIPVSKTYKLQISNCLK